ncbi:DUF3107 domain-containing protein [Angustibacter sp. Root456]|uniref:DUF3107 domain-containing protein n=1 Tax=Angustibacter sp. Root456 TaxID=1736539 RepID=UPI0006FC108A|nr:DUF3107 domain-containing protein [Angustibacter sp. Root456]KQX69849.1 ATP-binding protein [Angustibacter sp. Root456]
MEVKIGVQNVAREITFESPQTADEVATLVDQAVQTGAMLRLNDEKGRTVIVPGAVIGYVEVGVETERRVGFGTM